MTAKRQIESSINSGTMLDGTGGHVIRKNTTLFLQNKPRRDWAPCGASRTGEDAMTRNY